MLANDTGACAVKEIASESPEAPSRNLGQPSMSDVSSAYGTWQLDNERFGDLTRGAL